jgi:hypothetical protein
MCLWRVGGHIAQLEADKYHKYLIDCSQQELDAVRTCLQATCYGCQSEPRPIVRTRQTQGLKEEARVIDLCDSDIGEVTIVKSK